MSLGENIRKIRKEKGYSILKLRELTGLSKSTISEIENDKSSPTFETLNKIAKALEIRVETLISYDQLNEWDNEYHDLKEQNVKETTCEDFDEEIRAIARDMKNLSSDKKQLLHDLIKTMIQSGDDELKK